jgi:hypothetical protein
MPVTHRLRPGPRLAQGRAAGLWLALACFASAAGAPALGRQAAPPGQLPCALAEKQEFAPADEHAIKSYAAEHVAALQGEDLDASSRAREALTAPLSCKGLTFAFRLKYANLLTPMLSPLAQGQDERLAVNALVLMGRLRTTTSADALAAGLKSPSAARRFATASGYRELLGQLAKDSFGFPETSVDRMLDALGRGLASERDPLAADMFVIALGDATRGDALLRGRAAIRLASAVHDRMTEARKGRESAGPWSPTLLRALDLTRQTMFDQGGRGKIDAALAKQAGLMCGQVLAFARDRLAAEGKVQDSELSQTVGAADGLLAIAVEAAGGQRVPESGLQKVFDRAASDGDAKPFVAVLDGWIGASGHLTKPVFGGKASDFAPVK